MTTLPRRANWGAFAGRLSKLREDYNAGGWKRPASRLAMCIPAYALFFGVNLAHATFRGFGENIAPFKAVDVAQWDSSLFGQLPSVWLQDALGSAGFWAETAFLYWTTFFWIPTILIAVVAITHDKSFFLRLLLLHATLVISADIIYAIVPSRPPWMSGELVRIVAVQSQDGVHLDRNPLAAFPSLHVAVPLAFALWFRGLEEASPLRRLAPALTVWSFGMAFSVVYTGEHYVADVVAGYAWAALVFVVLSRLGLLHPRQIPAHKASHAAVHANTGQLVPQPVNAAARDRAA